MKTRQTIFCGLLAVILALAFTTCKDDDGGGGGDVNTASKEGLYGTWRSTTGSYQPYTLTITADTIRIQDKDGDFVQYAGVVWTAAANTNSANKTNYPNGYTFTGTRTYRTYSSSIFGFVALKTDGQSVYVGTSASTAISGLGGPIYTKVSGGDGGGGTGGGTPPVQLPTNAIPLTENQWADGNIATANGQQWFTFAATASTQYLHFDPTGTLNNVYVQVYDSNGAAVGSQTNLYGSTTSTSRTLTEGLTYYISVKPYSSSGSGVYQIAFNASTTAPPVQLPTDAIPLTANQWADGNIATANGQQWFTFTATASTQYLHFDPTGTLNNVYVQVYDSSGVAVGSVTNLSSSTTRTSRTLTEGLTYYIRVWPYSGSGRGAYRIAFNASTTAPIIAIPLTESQWTNGNILTSGDRQQWFTFTATASTQYIHFDPGTLYNFLVQVYDRSVTAVGSETNLSSGSNISSTSRTLTEGQTYYIRVRPSNNIMNNNGGTYQITFNKLSTPPAHLPTDAIPLIENQWADGNITTGNGVQWFTFTATASTQYIHFVPTGTLDDVYVQVYDSSGIVVERNSTNLNSSTTRTSRTLTEGQTYYISVWPRITGLSGTYWIGFNTSTTAPTIVQLPSSAIPLTENQWADGNISTSSGEQWFTFTATASTQYIHVSFGTLYGTYGPYVQVYDSSGAAVGSEEKLLGNSFPTSSTSRTLTEGQAYYIRVRPSSNNGNGRGTYRITFNKLSSPPVQVQLPTDAIPLTENQWADGSLPTSNDVQWFVFTATASTQYLHFDPTGTLTNVWVRVYDSSGISVGSPTGLYGSTTSTPLTLTEGLTYYIRVWPYSSNGSGAYRIGFGSIASIGTTPVLLTENQWADGSLPTSNDVQWFVFTAAASTQYIHAAFLTLGNAYGISVQVYDSSGAAVGSETNLFSPNNSSTSRSLTAGQTYYIRVRLYGSDSGTYQIGFNTSTTAPTS